MSGRVDVNVLLGAYPWRRVPGTTPEAVLAEMDRLGVTEAWATHLPGFWWRDPMEGNAWLRALAEREPRLRPVPAVHPGLAHWEEVVRDAADGAAPAVRCDPTWYGLPPVGAEMRALAAACGEAGVALQLARTLEDGRQRHPNDATPDLPPWAVRALLRADARVRVLVTHADRPFVEEVHFGSTPEEAARVWWDVCWIWGPPEDHLETLLATIGPERFVFGTGQPMRLPENALAKLDLLDLAPGARAAIEHGNARRLAGA